jgi:alcohol dehydrogenase (cytochrome c)
METTMKKLIYLLLGLSAVISCAVTQAQTQQELIADGNKGGNTDNVLTYGMGYHQQRFSPLKQITKANIKKLVPVWSHSLNNNVGEQAQPMIYNGVMYVTNVQQTVAIDIKTGRQIWATPIEWEREAARIVCCGLSNRGVAIYDGKVYVASLDSYIKALDAKTGKQLWRTKVAEWKDGYSITSAPSVANGVLMTGMTGGEYGVRGFVAGYDPQTGKELWRRFTTVAPGEKGSDTWPNDDSYLRGGGSTWITGSYDPELDLSFWGTGNGGPWNSKWRPGDNLYVASVIAIRPKTGEIAWHYQWTPAETYDFDGVNENVLADMTIFGQKRKALLHADRNGFMYVLDRTNGKLIAGHAYVPVNWAKPTIDPSIGRVEETDLAARLRAGEKVELQPRWTGGKNWSPMAYNPNKQKVYLPMQEETAIYQLNNQSAPNYKPGERYMGATNSTKERDPKLPWGYFGALDPVSVKADWRIPQVEFPIWSGTLVTGGGIVFTGKISGEFVAIDENTGKVLWEFQTGSAINAQPITYTLGGRQYVTVLSGLATGTSLRRETAGKVQPGAAVWTFAIMKD